MQPDGQIRLVDICIARRSPSTSTSRFMNSLAGRRKDERLLTVFCGAHELGHQRCGRPCCPSQVDEPALGSRQYSSTCRVP